MNEWENSSPNLREPYKNCTKKHYHDFNNGEFSFNYPFNNKKVNCKDVVDYCKQISRAKFYPDGIQKNGVRCRITEPVLAGDEIRVCLETSEMDFVQIGRAHV